MMGFVLLMDAKCVCCTSQIIGQVGGVVVSPCIDLIRVNHIRQTCSSCILHPHTHTHAYAYNYKPLCLNIQIGRAMATDYRSQYEQKCADYDEMNLQFTEYQEQSNFIISDLEEEVKELKKKNQAMAKQISEFKEKRKNFNNNYEKEIEQTRKERQLFKTKFIELEKKVIELQNINQNLQSDLRATRATLHEYQQRTEKTMEELALLQIQMEESTESSQEQIARLRAQLKETEDELYVLHHVKNKNQENPNKQKQNKNEESFHSKHGEGVRRSEITESKIRKRNIKFTQTLAEIRGYIQTISTKRQELSHKFEEHI